MASPEPRGGAFARGADTFFHRLRMQLWSTAQLALAIFGGCYLAFLVLGFWRLGPAMELVLLAPVAELIEHGWGQGRMLPFLARDLSLVWYPTAAFGEALATPEGSRAAVWLHAWAPYPGLAGMILFLLAAGGLWWHGRQLGASSVRRGARLVEAAQLARQLRARGAASDLELGGLPLVKDSETQHVCLIGGPSSGKTVALLELLDGIARRGDAALVFDRKPELIASCHRAARGDVLLNPMDHRSARWTPWAELRQPYDPVAIARSWIPEAAKGSQPFFTDASRVAAAGLLEAMTTGGDLVELARLATQGKVGELLAALRGTPAEAYLDSEAGETRDSIRATLATYSTWLRWLRPEAAPFSVRDWVTAVAAPANGPRPWLWLTIRGNVEEILAPLHRIWIETAVREILSLPVDRRRRLWLILDEFPRLGRMEALEQIMAQGRGHGAAVVLTFQNLGQLRDSYGRDGAAALLGQPATQVILRQNEPESAEWAARLLGEAELHEPVESVRYAAAEAGDAITLAERVVSRPVAMPAELMALGTRTRHDGQQELAGYARLPGGWPIARLKIRTRDRAATAPAWCEATADGTVDAILKQRRLAAAGRVAADQPALPLAAPVAVDVGF